MKYRHEFDSKYFRNFLCLKASFILILWRRSKFNKCQPLYYVKKLAFLNYCFGVPKGNRTPDTKFRKLVLYPTELLAQFLSCFLLYYFIVLYYFFYLFFYLLFFICYLLFTFLFIIFYLLFIIYFFYLFIFYLLFLFITFYLLFF